MAEIIHSEPAREAEITIKFTLSEVEFLADALSGVTGNGDLIVMIQDIAWHRLDTYQ